MSTTSIEWTETTWNPITSCDRISPGCDHCLAPETLVLMADYSLKPIGDLVVGEKVLSFTESPSTGQNRVIEIARVLATWRTEAPTVRITTASGKSVIASDNHRWLAQARPYWRRSDALSFKTRLCGFGPAAQSDPDSIDFLHGYLAGATAGDGTMRWDGGKTTDRKHKQPYWRVAVLESDSAILDRLVLALAIVGIDAAIRRFVQHGDPRGRFSKRNGQPPAPMAKVEIRNAAGLNAISDMLVEREASGWMAGWLSGFLDTDGTSDGSSIRWSQVKDNDYLDRTVKYCALLGFEATRESYLGDRATTVRLRAPGLSVKAQFLSLIRPALERKCSRLEGRRFSTAPESIVGLERGPVRELVDITTSSGTFIAAGLATHNCYALTMAKRLKAMGSAKLIGPALDDMGHRQIMRRVGKKAAGRVLDDRTWDEFPQPAPHKP